MTKKGLRQVGHGCDLVKLMDRIFIAIVVDDKRKVSLRWGGHTRTNAVALKAGIAWYRYVAGVATRAQSAPCSKLLRAQAPK